MECVKTSVLINFRKYQIGQETLILQFLETRAENSDSKNFNIFNDSKQIFIVFPIAEMKAHVLSITPGSCEWRWHVRTRDPGAADEFSSAEQKASSVASFYKLAFFCTCEITSPQTVYFVTVPGRKWDILMSKMHIFSISADC